MKNEFYNEIENLVRFKQWEQAANKVKTQWEYDLSVLEACHDELCDLFGFTTLDCIFEMEF